MLHKLLTITYKCCKIRLSVSKEATNLDRGFFMPRKFDDAKKKGWIEFYDQGKSEKWIANRAKCDVRTVRKAINEKNSTKSRPVWSSPTEISLCSPGISEKILF